MLKVQYIIIPKLVKFDSLLKLSQKKSDFFCSEKKQ